MRACAICVHADEHGWWGPGHRGTHCTQCHRHFGSNEAGDAHRLGDACRDPRGFARYDTPDGPIFGGRDPEDMAALRARRAAGHSAETAERGTA